MALTLPFQKPKSKQRGHIVLIVLIVFAAALVSGLFFWRGRILKNLKKVEAQELAVVATAPQGNFNSINSKISITFNLPVQAHHAEQYISISPPVQATVSQGGKPEQVVITPTTPFAPGMFVTVGIRAGLASDNGKKLLSDYSFGFGTRQNDNTINFLYKDWPGRVMSFQAGKAQELRLSVGGLVKNPSVKLYKASADMLVNSLVYNIDEQDAKYKNNPYYGIYGDTIFDTTSLEMVQEFKAVDDATMITLPGQTGLFLLVAYDGQTPLTNAWVSFNKIGVHLRQDDQSVYIATQNLETQKPESGVGVTLYSLNKEPKEIGRLTVSGIADYPVATTERLDIAVAKKGDDTLVIPVSVPNSQADVRELINLNEKHQVFIYTDRPIYKPGNKISFRGIVRVDNDGLYRVPRADTKVRVFTGNYTNTEKIFDQEFTTDSAGVFSGEITLAPSVLPETVYLYATTDLEKATTWSSNYAYFEIIEYKKPSFGLTIDTSSKEYVKGDNVNITIASSSFTGKPMGGQKISYAVYKRDYYETEKATYNSSFKLNGWGGMCGGGFGFGDEYLGQQIGDTKEVTLDQNGKATLSFDTKTLNSMYSQEATFVIEKEDENKNKITSAKNAIIHGGEFNMFLRPGPQSVVSGDSVTTSFYTEGLNGTAVPKQSFNYTIYDGDPTYNPSAKVYKTGTVQTNGEGVGTFTQRYESETGRSLFITVTGKDARGNTVGANRYVGVTPKSQPSQYTVFTGATQVKLKMISPASNLTPGKKASLSITAPHALTAFVTFERGRVYRPQWVSLKPGENTFSFDVPESFTPSITPTFSFFADGEYSIEGLSLNVPALHKVATVAVEMDKERYVPGETAQVTITTKDVKGNAIPATVGVGVVDKAIFALRKSAAQPLHSSYYFFRPRNTNASSSLTWISALGLGGKGGGGDGGVAPNTKDVDTLYWNPSITTGADGKATVRIPLGQSETTWRILAYASTADTKLGQGELDFLVAK